MMIVLGGRKTIFIHLNIKAVWMTIGIIMNSEKGDG